MEGTLSDTKVASRPYVMGPSSSFFLVPSTAAYVGPLDVLTNQGNTKHFWGLRAMSAAIAATGTQNCIDIVDQAGNNPLTVKILTTGALDVPAINTWVTANSVTTIKITKVYDQGGFSQDVSQATLANMPVLTLTGINSLPTMTFTAASGHFLQKSSFAFSEAQPSTCMAVAKTTANASVIVSYASGAANALISANSNGSWEDQSGTFSATASANHFHAGMSLRAAGAGNSNIRVDNGSPVTGTSNKVWIGNSTEVILGTEGLGDFMNGDICEVFTSEADQTANATAWYNNVIGYYGALP